MAGCMPFRTRISAFKAHVGPIQLPVPIQFAASDAQAVVILRLPSPSAEVAARRPASGYAVSTTEPASGLHALLALEFSHWLVSRSMSTISDWDYCLTHWPCHEAQLVVAV